MDYTKELKHLSLCAGYGGIDLGLARALGAVRTVAFVEIEAFAVVNLVKKIEAGHLDECPIFTDLKAFPWELYRGQVDILSGGFPCQPFSSAGRRAGDSDPRHLWPYIANGVRRLGHPSIVFLENVEGIISSKLTGSEWSDPEGTPVLLHVIRELERLGYEATAGVFSASEVGAPHQRKRVFILGCRADLSETGRGIVGQLLRETERGQELGNPQHNGHPPSEIRGGDGASPDSRAQGKDSEREPQRAGNTLQVLPTAYPAPRGAEQYPWEPPRVTMGDSDGRKKRPRLVNSTLSSEEVEDGETGELGGSDSDRHEPRNSTGGKNSPGGVEGEIESSVGGDSYGATSRMVYAKLCESLDNRTDELRLLGNGVVPATAERAFRVLWAELGDSSRFTARRNLRALFS